MRIPVRLPRWRRLKCIEAHTTETVLLPDIQESQRLCIALCLALAER